MSDLTSNEGAVETALRELLNMYNLGGRSQQETIDRLTARVAELEAQRPQEASDGLGATMSAADLRRLWDAEIDDADKLLAALGLGDKATISEQYRSEGGFLRVGKIVAALKARAPVEPGEGQLVDAVRDFLSVDADISKRISTEFGWTPKQIEDHAIDLQDRDAIKRRLARLVGLPVTKSGEQA